MKIFIKNIPGQSAVTFAIMTMCYTIITLAKGDTQMPVIRLPELFLLSVFGGILMEFAFGTCVFKQITDVKRVFIFIIPFSVITFIFAVIFRWITELKVISTYIRFVGIFIGCGILSIILFEIEHRIRGREYTKKLREYQNGGSSNEQ